MNKNSVDKALVRSLAELLHENNLTEIEYDADGVKIKVACNPSCVTHVVPSNVQRAPKSVNNTENTKSSTPAPIKQAGDIVASPMVGVVYVAAEALAKPYVKVGDKVTKGQTLFIIEAMKTFNPVKAPRAGKVVEIFVKDADLVEYDEPLLLLE